jgi:hypothetical protein
MNAAEPELVFVHGTSALARPYPPGMPVPSAASSARVRERKTTRLPLPVLHISAGIIGRSLARAANSFGNGSGRHHAAGNVFDVSMLIMGLCAFYLAVLKHQINNVVADVLHGGHCMVDGRAQS